MQIINLGHACFKIQTKTSKGDITIVTDPYDKKIGFKMPKTTADIVTISHNHYDHSNAGEVNGDPFVVNGPGEYEVKGIFVYGIPSFHDKQDGRERGNNTINVIKLMEEDISIAHLGDLGHVLGNKELEHLEKIDILLIPVGGKYTISTKEAIEVINQIEPRIVIPMHYKIPGLKIDGLSGVDVFCKEMGVNGDKTNKLKISKKDLPQEETRVVVLER
jgi:L-ascorbate metabolism protein UlaG (beta-lactamase superfamily)